MMTLNAAVWEATIKGDFHLLDEALRSGADVNEPRHTRYDPQTTLLHAVAYLGNAQHVRALLNYGARHDVRDSRNRTPLHWAVLKKDNPEVVEMLISEGALVDARCISESTPFHQAVSKGFNESGQVLMATGAAVDAVTITGCTSLHVAALVGNCSMVKLLVGRGVDKDVEDSFGITPLHLAAGNKLNNIVQFLLNRGAEVNKKTTQGKFPLYYAASHGSPASLYLLLKRGARVNEVTSNGNTALHVACQLGLANITTLLIKYGADVNIRNHEGMTAFNLLPNNRTSRSTAMVLIRHSVKLEALKQHVCETYKQMVQSCNQYHKYDQQCREEVTLMKSTKIEVDDSAVSYFYIFSTAEEKLAELLKNQKILAEFETTDCQRLFKIYSYDIVRKFIPAKRRAKFLILMEDCLEEVFARTLPKLVVRKIARYMTYNDVIIPSSA